jgi:hypothetical protein
VALESASSSFKVSNQPVQATNLRVQLTEAPHTAILDENTGLLTLIMRSKYPVARKSEIGTYLDPET